jgi:hypothetical protein
VTAWPYLAKYLGSTYLLRTYIGKSRSILNHLRSEDNLWEAGMAEKDRAVRRSPAIPKCLVFLAPLLAIASFAYTFLSPASRPFAFQSSLWQALGRELPRSTYSGEWLMQTTVLSQNEFQAYPYVSNGYFGQTLPAEGVGYWVQQNKSTASGGFSVNSLCPSIFT